MSAYMTVVEERGSQRPSLRRSFTSLESPRFRGWFISQVLSASGTMTQSVATAWLLLRLTGSSVDLGLMSTCTFLPVLVLGPHAGALVDRVDRRKLLIATQISLCALSAAAAAIVASGVVQAWMLFLIGALTGTVTAPDSTARQVYVVDLVGAGRLASAVSLNEVVLNTSRIVGPALGGALLATVGIAACYAVNAGSYVIPLFVLLTHKSVDPANPRTTGRAGRPAVSLRDAARYAWRHGPIRVSLFLAAASGLLFNLGVSLPVLATRVFHLGGGGYGLMMSSFGIGALPGALLAAAWAGHPTGRRVGWLALATAACVLGTAFSPVLWLTIAGLAMVGCLSIWFIAAANTLVQITSAPGMRGRVMGLWTMALPGMSPVNSPLAGLVTQDIGAREGFALSGLALTLVATIGWRPLTRETAGDSPV
jgi:MFS family permease